jgi:hypothetical protein
MGGPTSDLVHHQRVAVRRSLDVDVQVEAEAGEVSIAMDIGAVQPGCRDP